MSQRYEVTMDADGVAKATRHRQVDGSRGGADALRLLDALPRWVGGDGSRETRKLVMVVDATNRGLAIHAVDQRRLRICARGDWGGKPGT